MAEGDVGAGIADLEFEGATGITPDMIHVSGDVYAIAYEGPGNDGWLKTVTISDAGAMALVAGGSLEFDEAYGMWSRIIHIKDDVFAIAHRGPGDDCVLKTVTISAAGAMALVAGGSLIVDAGDAREVDIAHVEGAVYAVVYRHSVSGGKLATVTIGNDGIMAPVVGGELIFYGAAVVAPRLMRVAAGMFVIAFKRPDGTGWLQTVTISDAGITALVAGGSLEFDAVLGEHAMIVHVAGEVSVVAYRGPDGDGWLKTVTISDAGAMALIAGGSLEFDIAAVEWPEMVYVSGGVYAILYNAWNTAGRVRTVTISAGGAISFRDETGLSFVAGNGFTPTALHVTGDVYAVAYQKADIHGWITTFNIETILAGLPRHLMMMGIG